MCEAAAREVAQVMNVPLVAVTRYDDDVRGGTSLVVELPLDTDRD